jgi:hypothetical protein
METSTSEQAGADTATYATDISDQWPSLAGDRRGWSVEAVTDRL